MTDPDRLVPAALTQPSGRAELREALRHISEMQVEGVFQRHPEWRGSKEEAVEAGLNALDRALHAFTSNGRHLSNEIKFAEYFGWWARQAIMQHIRRRLGQ